MWIFLSSSLVLWSSKETTCVIVNSVYLWRWSPAHLYLAALNTGDMGGTTLALRHTHTDTHTHTHRYTHITGNILCIHRVVYLLNEGSEATLFHWQSRIHWCIVVKIIVVQCSIATHVFDHKKQQCLLDVSSPVMFHLVCPASDRRCCLIYGTHHLEVFALF